VLGDLDPRHAESLVDAVVRPVRPRVLAVGLTALRPGRPPVIEVGSPGFSTREDREYLLSRAYRAALAAADALGAGRLAVPTVLTWGPWPLESGIRVALGVLESTPTRVREVVVVTVTPAGLEAWAERLASR
jgi:hypothetical protein